MEPVPLDEFAPLTERRKADRAIMAHRVVDLASEYGLAAWHRPELPGSRETPVDLAGPHGLRTTVRFRGDSPQPEPDTYVLSWYGVDHPVPDSGIRLNPDRFGDVNPHHGCKATDVARGFHSLIALLAVRFASIKDGTAFIRTDPDPVPGSPEWNAGVPTKREAAAGLDDDSVSLTDYLRNLHVRE
jgi:hypothetical protein